MLLAHRKREGIYVMIKSEDDIKHQTRHHCCIQPHENIPGPGGGARVSGVATQGRNNSSNNINYYYYY